jgi:hypothetical protein
MARGGRPRRLGVAAGAAESDLVTAHPADRAVLVGQAERERRRQGEAVRREGRRCCALREHGDPPRCDVLGVA